MKIKAAVCREFAKPLSIEEVELAAPAAGETRVNVAACAMKDSLSDPIRSDASISSGF